MTFAVGAPVRARRGTLPVAVGAAVVVSLVGLGVGQLWRAVAPRVAIIRVEQGFIYADSEPEQSVGADGWFLFLGLGAGLLLAVLAWVVLRRHRGPAVLVALIVGSLVGAWLGWWLGVWLDQEAFRAAATDVPLGTHLQAPLSLGMTGLDHDRLWPPEVTGVVLAQALAAAVGYTTMAGFSADPLLRPGSERTEAEPAYGPQFAPPPFTPPPPLSWGQTAGPEQQTWPPAALAQPQSVPSDPPASSGPGGPAGPAGWPAPPGSG